MNYGYFFTPEFTKIGVGFTAYTAYLNLKWAIKVSSEGKWLYHHYFDIFNACLTALYEFDYIDEETFSHGSRINQLLFQNYKRNTSPFKED